MTPEERRARRSREEPSPTDGTRFVMEGIGVSSGYAIGPAFRIDRRRIEVPRYHIDADQVDAEVVRLQTALDASEAQIQDIRDKLSEAGDEHGLILEAHQMMLRDEALVDSTRSLLRDAQGNLVLVLHQLGNHGPSYFRRYPEAFRRFTPTCDDDDLSQCNREQIVNSYDNALLYTDHVLARTIDLLKDVEDKYDSALVYVSDHGESLGENGLYLHGLPYSIAPSEQTRVPMVMWFSPGFAARNRLDLACLDKEAQQPTSHDTLFHTVLGLLDVTTSIHEPALDLGAACRR